MYEGTLKQTQQPVTLEGYQAVMKPSKFGYSMTAIVDQEMIDLLEDERPTLLDKETKKLANPRRSVLKPEPWEEVAEGQYKIKFTWNEKKRPAVVDSVGTIILDEELPLYSGAQVKLAFKQTSYVLKDKVTYGTSLKLVGVQVISLNTNAGVDTGTMAADDVAELFGKTEGFKASDPNVTPNVADDDF